VADDLGGYIHSGSAFDSLQTRRGVDLHDDRSVFAFQHVDAGDLQIEDLSGSYGGSLVFGIKHHALSLAAAVYVAAEFGPRSSAAHGGDYSIAHHERADIASFAFRYKLLHQHILLH